PHLQSWRPRRQQDHQDACTRENTVSTVSIVRPDDGDLRSSQPPAEMQPTTTAVDPGARPLTMLTVLTQKPRRDRLTLLSNRDSSINALERRPCAGRSTSS